MQHAAIEDRTPFAFAHLFTYDEGGRPLVVVVSQATFEIVADASQSSASHRLALVAEQPPVALAGTRWEPTLSELSPDPTPHEADVVSYRIEPCVAFFKPCTDVVLVGHAHARDGNTTAMRAGLKVGSLEKLVVVHGDRYWQREGGDWVPGPAKPFDRIPLRYERAFGGWDRSHPNPREHHAFAQNPLGLGYRGDEPREADEGSRLPNIEDPSAPIERHGQIVPPAGFGFIAPGWEPRSKLAGTYDEAWMESRMPYLAHDFDRRFFNAAPPGLVADGYLSGGEPVAVFGATPVEHMLFALPTINPPSCTIERVAAEDAVARMALDTVIIDTDHDRVTLLFRGHAALRDGPRDVRSLKIAN